jgi:hypothetical protein
VGFRRECCSGDLEGQHRLMIPIGTFDLAAWRNGTVRNGRPTRRCEFVLGFLRDSGNKMHCLWAKCTEKG